MVKLYSSQFDEAHKFRKYSSAVVNFIVGFEFVEDFVVVVVVVVVVIVVASLFIVAEFWLDLLSFFELFIINISPIKNL